MSKIRAFAKQFVLAKSRVYRFALENELWLTFLLHHWCVLDEHLVAESFHALFHDRGHSI
jgi:hypothetical protein